MSESEPVTDNTDAAASEQALVVDYEQSEQVQEMLKVAPFALPLPVELLKENRVAVSEIPKGLLLNHYAGDLDVRVNSNSPAARPSGLTTFRKTPRSERSASEWSNGEKEASLVSTPLPDTNKGRNPNSRWYIRGVLHNHPLHLYLGAVATFFIVWLMPAAVITAVLLILSTEMPEEFVWVTPQLIWIPAVMTLVGIIYLIFGLTSKCCVCKQKLFVYRSRNKNTNSHHITGLGYVLPLAVHLILFRWFRCAHCGTPVRLKK